MADFPMQGGCGCGTVRYRMETAPLVVHCCHCTWCQRETGTAFALNAMIEADRVVALAGAPEIVATPSLSGRGQRIARCPECRIALWSSYSNDALRFVRVGTLDGRATIAPDIHIFTTTKMPWVMVEEGVPQVPDYYRRSQVWRTESLQRWTALTHP